MLNVISAIRFVAFFNVECLCFASSNWMSIMLPYFAYATLRISRITVTLICLVFSCHAQSSGNFKAQHDLHVRLTNIFCIHDNPQFTTGLNRVAFFQRPRNSWPVVPGRANAWCIAPSLHVLRRTGTADRIARLNDRRGYSSSQSHRGARQSRYKLPDALCTSGQAPCRQSHVVFEFFRPHANVM